MAVVPYGRPLQRWMIDTSPDFSNPAQTIARGFRRFCLQAWQTAELAALKAAAAAAGVSIVVLMYQETPFSVEGFGPGGISASGVNYSEAGLTPASPSNALLGAHPDWFMTSIATGQPFFSSGSGWAMDVGHAGYQARWLSNVLTKLQANPWDGVHMDDCFYSWRYHHTVADIAPYGTDTLWDAAFVSFVAAVAPTIIGAGFLVVPNNSGWTVEDDNNTKSNPLGAFWKRISAYTSGVYNEYWGAFGPSSGGQDCNAGWQAAVDIKTGLNINDWCESNGKLSFNRIVGPDGCVRKARYGYALSQMSANGLTSTILAPNATTEEYFPEYGYDIGAPYIVVNGGAYTIPASNVYRRRFTKGEVWANADPTIDSVATFAATASGSDVASAGSAALPANTGLIVTYDSAVFLNPVDIPGKLVPIKLRRRNHVVKSGGAFR